jgi:hypothetical protein
MRVAITASRRGEIALAYLGTSDGQNYNGYITESRNVLTRRPVFWSASVNKPAAPLVYGSDPTARSGPASTVPRPRPARVGASASSEG